MTRSYIVIYHAMFSPTAPTVHSLIICWFASLLFSAFGLILEEENEPNYLNAGVGEYEVFNCDLDFPHETPIPYILQWNRDVSATTLISKYRRFHLVGFISPYEIRTTRTETILLNFDKQYYSSQDAKISTCLSVTWFVVTRGRWNLDSSKCIDTGIARYRSWSFKEIDSSSQGDNLYSRYNDSWSSCNLIKIIETRRLIYVSSLRPDPVILTRCKVEKTRSTSINPSNQDYVYQRTVCAYVQPRRKVLARGRVGDSVSSRNVFDPCGKPDIVFRDSESRFRGIAQYSADTMLMRLQLHNFVLQSFHRV